MHFFSDHVFRDDPLDLLKIFSDPIRKRLGEKIEKLFFKSQYIFKDVSLKKLGLEKEQI